MDIQETQEEKNQLLKLCSDKNEKIAFLANYIQKIIFSADNEEDYKSEQREKG